MDRALPFQPFGLVYAKLPRRPDLYHSISISYDTYIYIYIHVHKSRITPSVYHSFPVRALLYKNYPNIGGNCRISSQGTATSCSWGVWATLHQFSAPFQPIPGVERLSLRKSCGNLRIASGVAACHPVLVRVDRQSEPERNTAGV